MNIESMVARVESFPSNSSRIYERVNSGLFHEESHSEVDLFGRVELTWSEQLVAMEIKWQSQYQNHVCMVGVGEMYAASMVILGIYYKDMIESGKLQLIATNLEPDFSIQSLLNEAIRRLELQDVFLEIQQLPNYVITQYPDTIQWLKEETMPLLSASMIDVIQEHNDVVTYVPSVDTLHLEKIFGSKSVHIMHEHIGGLKRHSNKSKAAEAMSNTLAPGGVLFTLEHLDEPPYSSSIDDFQRLGFTIHDVNLTPLHQLHVKSPMRNEYRVYVKASDR